MATVTDTYMRVCVLERDHDGEHLPYHLAPDADEFGNKAIAQPRCVHVSPMPTEEPERYRVVFELIDPRMPSAGWHEVVREHGDLVEAQQQMDGLRRLEAEGDDVRSARLERAVIKWEPVA